MSVEVKVGQTWQSKKDSWRQVLLTHEYEGRDRSGAIHTFYSVRRTTSRRTQGIRRDTLLRNYKLLLP